MKYLVLFSLKHQALFSSKDKSKKNKSIICCNFACSLRVIPYETEMEINDMKK